MPTDILKLLQTAKPGDTIALPAGEYAPSFRGLNFAAPGVTITSADPANPAVLTKFNIGINGESCSGLTFRSVDLRVDLPAYGAFNVYGSQRIYFDRVHVYGPPGAPDPNAAALNFFDCDGIGVTNCEIERAAHGLSVARSDNITVTGNNIHHMNADTLDFVQVGNVTVSGNALHDFYPTLGNHPDAMQFATVNSTKSSHDIAITGNLIYRGQGQNAQGIFMGDELEIYPFQNVTITDNLIVGTGSSALRPTHCRGLSMTGNELVTLVGGDPTNVLVQTSDQVVAIRNSAALLSITEANGNTDITQNGNATTVAVSQAEADAKVAAWLAAHPGPWSAAVAPVPVPPAIPPPPPVPPPVDPSAKYIAALKAVIALGTTANAKRAGPTKADMAGVLAVVKAALS